MGTAKALLPVLSGGTFVSHLLTTLRAGGIAEPLVVGRSGADRLRVEVELHGGGYVENPEADAGGQLSSLLTGLTAADRAGLRAVLVVPVDTPLVTPSTIAALIAVFEATSAPIVRPRHAGRHGHPVIFSRAVFDDLRRADRGVGAKAVVRAHAQSIVNVDVDDPGVLADVDTPDSYRALFGRDPFTQI